MNVCRQKAFWGQSPFSSPRTAQGRGGGGEGGGEREGNVKCQNRLEVGVLFLPSFATQVSFFSFFLFGFSFGLPLQCTLVSMDLVKVLDRV